MQHRKPMRERLGRWCFPASLIGGVVVLTVVFWAALVLVALIPPSLVADNVAASQEVIELEGDYPVSYATGMPYDNFTVEIMLGQVGSMGDMGDGQSPLTAALVPGYARYWHGYSVFLKPLLVVWGIYRIRFACQVVFALLTAIASALLCIRLRRAGAAAACALVLSLSFVGSFDAVACLPLFPSFALSLLATMWVLAPGRVADRDGRVARAGFFLVGALTVYFDMLDNPIITLGIPLAVYALRAYAEGVRVSEAAKLAVSCCVTWLLGYALLWAAKWFLASAVLGIDVVGDAANQVQLRVGVGEGAAQYDTSPLSAIRLNLTALGWPMWLLVFAFVAVCVEGALTFARGGQQQRAIVGWLVFLLVIAAFPYVWYAVLSNHSAVHYSSIAFRDQLIAFYALGIALILGAPGCKMRVRGRTDG